MVKFFIICLSVFLLSCSEKEPFYNSQSYVFGTLVDISIYGEPDNQARMISADIVQTFQQLHNDLHAWKPSKLKALNKQLAIGNTAYANNEISAMIDEAIALSTLSNGLFNPAIGNLIQIWGFQSDEFKPINIDADKIASLVANNPQMTDLNVDGRKVTSNNPSVQLDLGGFAKGYALDVGLKILKQKGVKNGLINIGGNVIAIGQHGDKPWRVGIQHPRKPNAIAALNLDSGWAIGTSGDYQRYFMLNGKRYCHIIDPRTGYPAQGTQSVTVLIPPSQHAGVLSDVDSKPIFIAADNQKKITADNMGVKDFMIIQENGDILISQSMQKRIEWLDPDAKKHLKILP